MRVYRIGVTKHYNMNEAHNEALHRTATPLRSIASGELCRWRQKSDLTLW